MITAKKHRSIESRHRRNGFLFILPWFIGVCLFFLKPLFQTVYFSFSKVSVDLGGFETKFVGFENYKYALFGSPEYLNNLMDSLSDFAYQIPIILILSFIIAVVLNSKFKGRSFFRSLYFIPVIIINSVVMQFLGNSSSVEELSGAAQSAYLGGLIDFEGLFLQMGIPVETTNLIFGYVNQIFDLIWQCGVQIVLFISGLQSIPEQLYEVSKVEGASKWEEFWYITVPMLGNSIVLVVIYTVVEFCVSQNNKVITQAYKVLLDQQIYDISSAMLWLYFAIIGSITATLFIVFYRLCLKKWQ
ncbi:MAG: sugar ABC transporter permease [Ruminococcaceae bacterium]|nr:sugar ABC transporter permease [Oscillospiraceae bacterium]